MNKGDLIDTVSARTNLPKADAAQAVDAVFDAITAALKAGDSVSLVGFGAFSVKARAARSGRNPRTGENDSPSPRAGFQASRLARPSRML